MSQIELKQVAKKYSVHEVLRNINCSVESGEFLVLVGPSGCGKSTLLRMIGGLEDISSGDLSMNGKVLNDVQPRERGMAMVFQNYALYPQLTVAENIGFPLKLRRVKKEERTRRVKEVAASIGLSHLLDRKPKELSGGQRQRVAIGRAIVREPSVFLMDEPLSNLDAKLRVDMRAELRALHSRLGITTIYVTHDQTEAMTLGTRVAVLRPLTETMSTNLQQIASPAEMYRRPANVFVAGFVGSPSMNMMLGAVESKGSDFRVSVGSGYFDFESGDRLAPLLRAAVGKQVIVGVRPGDFEIGRNGSELSGTVKDSELLGDDIAVQVQIDAPCVPYDWRFGEQKLESLSKTATIVARLPATALPARGEKISLKAKSQRVMLFDAAHGKNMELV
ncbi:ABC transporter ATP-binding protein [Rhizobium sp. X9]|uniref:ABC transporter ATP-binding protein n=1 Tax=Rhizobium sp. X9 TaxID=2815360 RepID=UPI001C0BA6FE|nr:ABC transporter ATP-binding protein [Rhizobium sp. X9]